MPCYFFFCGGGGGGGVRGEGRRGHRQLRLLTIWSAKGEAHHRKTGLDKVGEKGHRRTKKRKLQTVSGCGLVRFRGREIRKGKKKKEKQKQKVQVD